MAVLDALPGGAAKGAHAGSEGGGEAALLPQIDALYAEAMEHGAPLAFAEQLAKLKLALRAVPGQHAGVNSVSRG